MQLNIESANPFPGHPGRRRFDLFALLADDARAAAMHLRRGRAGGARFRCEVVLDGTLTWLELFPGITNPRVVPLHLEQPVSVDYQLDPRDPEKTVVLDAIRRPSPYPTTSRNQAVGGFVELQIRSTRVSTPLRLVLHLERPRDVGS